MYETLFEKKIQKTCKRSVFEILLEVLSQMLSLKYLESIRHCVHPSPPYRLKLSSKPHIKSSPQNDIIKKYKNFFYINLPIHMFSFLYVFTTVTKSFVQKQLKELTIQRKFVRPFWIPLV